MAMNPLGELEGTPGADERLLAYLNERLAESSKKAAQGFDKNARNSFNVARKNERRYRLATDLPADMRVHTPGHYARESRLARQQALDLCGEAKKHFKQARKARRAARRAKVSAFCKTWAARLGFKK